MLLRRLIVSSRPLALRFDVLGLHAEVLFLKDALQQIGVQVDVVQISPYKTAMDMLQHADITPEYQAQLDWLLDDQFDTITAAMASGRGLSQDEIKDLIDQAPFFAEAAREKMLVDDLAYEDELALLLAGPQLAQSEELQNDAQENGSVLAGKEGVGMMEQEKE